MNVAVVGSRNCQGFCADSIIAYLPKECDTIISGGALGVDSFAQLVAKKLNLQFECILPNYEKDGKNAPLFRNQEIVRRADMVLAFWDFQSRGTAHTIAYCIEMGVPVRVIGLDECAGRI